MKVFLKTLLPALCMLILILDPNAAVRSASEAIQLSLKTVVPSLFPFFVLSSMLTSALVGSHSIILRPIGRFCRMQQGTESILLIGLLGGYPTGAQITAQAWRDGTVDKSQARRMLGFCCNAGPAFLFGICGSLFPAGWMAWLLWGIHIVSAVLTARNLPEVPFAAKSMPVASALSLPEALDRALRNIARVCGWVILFRVLIGVLERWLTMLPESLFVLISGILELTNGCMMLKHTDSVGLRFYLCALFLSFGGLCVLMQTVSVAGELGIRYYLRGKALQTVYSGLLCLAFMIVFFPDIWKMPSRSVLLLLVMHLFALILIKRKKTVAFRKRLVYNQKKQESWT